MEFEADYSPSKALLGQFFYESLRLLIKIWIDKEGQKLLAWDDLVERLSKVKAKVKIWNNRNLDQYCHKKKQLLKVLKKAHDNQLEKTQPKASLTTRTLSKLPDGFPQGIKASKKARIKKKKKWQKEKQERKKTNAEVNIQATRSNTTASRKKKSHQN